MPKIIVTSRYMRNTPKLTATNLVKYMGTREGVEKLPTGTNYSPSTVRQQRLIKDILKYDSDAEKYLEYEDYLKESSKANATEFIDAFIERNADRIGDMDKLVSYIAKRPGVEKLGSHGLFSQTDDKIDLDSVADEIGHHKGIIWTHVISLRREDAERLGYNNAQAWKDLVRRNITEIADAQNINLDNMQWYGAFHNTTHHPHMHLLIYAKDAKQGWLTKKGIDELRSTFGNDIFRNEQYKLFRMETELRNKLKEDAKYTLYELIAGIDNSYEPTPKVLELFQILISHLESYTGRKQYGYLPLEVKDTVNKIVIELAKNDDIAKLYSEWNRVNKEKLSLYYDKKKPDIPLEDNKEFRSIKNMIIKAAVEIIQSSADENYTHQTITTAIRNLAKALCLLISQSYTKKLSKLNKQIDSKLKSKIEQKKAAHGLKTDYSVIEYSEDDEQDMSM